MASLRSVDVLQIDATIIAGLLILLTIQSASDSSKEIGFIDHSNVLEEIKIKNQTYANVAKSLQAKLSQVNPSDVESVNTITKQIDEYEAKNYETSLEYKERSLVRDQYPEKLPTSQQKISKQQLVQSLAVAMIIPFVGSIGWEVIATFDKKEEKNEKATKGSRIWMVGGFIMVIFGLYGLQIINSIYP